MSDISNIIKHLNKILRNEIIAVNQYIVHANMYKNWGLIKLSDKEKRESIDEIQHTNILIDRILFLKGTIKIENIPQITFGKNTEEILQYNLKTEKNAISDLKEAIKHTEHVHDYITHDLYCNILRNEEEHIHWIENQIHLISVIGIKNYIQLQCAA